MTQEEKPVTVYGQPNCPSCVRVVEKLQDAGVGFDYVDISKHQYHEARVFVTEVLGAKSVPVVVDDYHEPILGYQPDQLAKLVDYHKESK